MAPASIAPAVSPPHRGGPAPDTASARGEASLGTGSIALAAAPNGCHPPSAEQPWLELRCACGRTLRAQPSRDAGNISCECGNVLAACRHGLADFAPAIAISRPAPLWWPRLMAEARRTHWRQAAERCLPPPLLDDACHPNRAACGDLLPLPPGARVLVLAAGLGGIAAPLARQFSVVAVEAAPERAAFLALRARQDGLDRLLVLRADWRSLGLLPGQFDAIIAPSWEMAPAAPNGADRPRPTPLAWLCAARNLLAPAGILYLAAPNRWAVRRRREPNHVRVSEPPRSIRAHSYFGYRRLFRRAGLRLQSAYLCLPDHRCPLEMVPRHPAALAFRARHQPWQAHRPLRAWLHRICARPWLWPALGGDFAFLLAATPPRPIRGAAGSAPPPPSVAASSHPPPIPLGRAAFPAPNGPDSAA